MTTIHLASFLEQHNFGPGKIIGIVDPIGGRPKNIKVDSLYKQLTPSVESVNIYNEMRPSMPEKASEIFVASYISQLEMFFLSVKNAAENMKCDMVEVLPFKDGDTLCSWERENFTNYRKVLAPYLTKIGFDVVLH